MTTRNEQLSAFLDDELHDSECSLVVRRLGSDEELRATAFRMSLIGDTMRGELSGADPAAFRSAVKLAVEDISMAEPPVVAAKSGWMRPLVGAAVAASVAFVAVLSLQQASVVDTQAPAETVPIAEIGAPGSSTTYTVPGAYSRQAGSPNRLSRYYLVHSEYASMMGGQAPLARMVVAPGESDENEDGGVAEAENEESVETR